MIGDQTVAAHERTVERELPVQERKQMREREMVRNNRLIDRQTVEEEEEEVNGAWMANK